MNRRHPEAGQWRSGRAGRRYRKTLPSAGRGETLFSFGAEGEFSVQAAASLAELKTAWRLAGRVYGGMGYARGEGRELWYSLHDAVPEAVTCTVERRKRPLGAITLVPDSPCGLPAERTFPQEVNRLRAAGRRLAESVSLVQESSSESAGARVVRKLLELTCLVPRRVLGATDMICTVNPRHLSYYRRLMRFEQLGGVHYCQRVGGAPAVFLVLDLERAAGYAAEARLPGSRRTLYRGFMDEESSERVARAIRARPRRITREEFVKCFVLDRRLLREASARARAYLSRCYGLTGRKRTGHHETTGVHGAV